MSAEHDGRLRWYQRRVSALETLLACYRLGQQPSERLHTELERTGRYIAHDGTWRETAIIPPAARQTHS